ncbi:hypothetical protein [Candidatus Kuenenia stuttgartiensis]|uniref:Uncharacterized protein n=1 Tax=Kuenenia stuttgartiensis TaxID=174633 RepID=Q1Q0H8_KUEST|nr:hypothetical protein [Candidatus Kuenenia stuttgartiensis]CAJ72023.1 unknown protein [Candidatus Kuenenia stuttgartiensis]
MAKFVTLFLAPMVFSTLTGCITVETKTSKDTAAHLAQIDQKINTFEKQFKDLDYTTKNATTRIEMLTQKNMSMDAKYSNLSEMLTTIRTDLESKNNSMETTLSYLTNDIETIEKHLGEIEKANSELRNQIAILQNQRLISQKEDTTFAKKAIIPQTKETPLANRELIKEEKNEVEFPENEEALEIQTDKKPFAREEMKELSDAQKKERLQTLLDDALEQYREGNYQEAIARWEKVLELEPDNLEAKFNIEITKEKMKSLSKN